MKNSALVFCFLCLCSFIQAQNEIDFDHLDSLCHEVKIAKSDSVLLEIYFEIAKAGLYLGERDSTSKYVKKAFLLAEKSGNQTKKADALLILGKIELTSFGPRDHATQHFLKSLALYRQLKNRPGIANCNLQLGVLSYDMANFDDAAQYLKISLKYVDDNLGTKATLHYLLALCYAELSKFNEANALFDSASIGYGLNNTVAQLQIETFRGKMYCNQGDYAKAISQLTGLIKDYSTKVDVATLAPSYAFASTAYLKAGDYKNATRYGKRAFILSKGKASYIIYLREAEESLHEAYHHLNKPDSAYFYLNDLSQLKDSISNNTVMQRIAELKGRFEYEQEIEQQKAAQNLRDAITKKEMEREIQLKNVFLVALIFVLLFAGLFLNQRNKISKEKMRSDQLLLNILPSKTADELKAKGSAEARYYQNATVIFTDFIGFTQLSASLNPKELVHEIHSYFTVFDEIIEKYNIEKIKTIGDAYMAASGLPTPYQQSTKNAVLAALEMFEYLKNKQSNNSLPTFKMRCGLHTGPIVAGIVGIKKFQYDIWGDTVNTANRMESNGSEGKVNISETTFQILKNDPEFVFESRGEIDVKGKGRLKMYFVKRAV